MEEHDDRRVAGIEPKRRGIQAVVLIGDPAGAGGLAVWRLQIESLLAGGRSNVVRCDVADLGGRAGAVLDALVRLQLTARRCGGAIQLHHPPPELLELLRITGLAEVFAVSDPLCGEIVGQPEEREQRRFQEGVDADDAGA